MRKTLAFICTFFTLYCSAQIDTNRLILFEDERYFINGLNVPWGNFGSDVGRHDLWGAPNDTVWFEKIFSDCQEYGANVVRLWIHCDGRTNPEFDEKGFCTGVDPDFFIDLDDIFRRAKHHDVMIMPCLWSFDMCKDSRLSAGEHAGNHCDLLQEEDKMQSYLDNVFAPMVERYKDQCNLFAWEVCNEPEWALDRLNAGLPESRIDTQWTYRLDYKASVESMQKLTSKMASIVHNRTDQLITTGSAAIMWNSDVKPAIGNIWSDSALIGVTGDPKGILDFYQIHFYDYMSPFTSDPFDTNYSASYWEYDKPVIIGETPASPEKSKLYTPDTMLINALQNEYAGVMFWSYNGDDGFGIWGDFKDALKRFKEAHPDIVEPQKCPCGNLSKSYNVNAKLEGKKIIVSWNEPDVLHTGSYGIELLVDKGTMLSKKVKAKGKTKMSYKLKCKGIKPTEVQLSRKDVYGFTDKSTIVLD